MQATVITEMQHGLTGLGVITYQFTEGIKRLIILIDGKEVKQFQGDSAKECWMNVISDEKLTSEELALYVVCPEVFGISFNQIKVKGRKPPIPDFRKMICKYLRENTKYSLEEIAQIVSNHYKHDSVIAAIKRLEQLIEVEPATAEKYQLFEEKMNKTLKNRYETN